MSASEGEPEKYSLDEMMERLKTSSSSESATSEGELVTRADGSQAVKVRKRKRRSSQPHKKALVRTQRMRVIQISALFVLLLGGALLIGGAIVYSNSQRFHDNVVRLIADTTGAEIELKGFRMNPTHANARSVELTWGEHSPLQRLSANVLTAHVSPLSFTGRFFGGDELQAKKGELVLQAPHIGNSTGESPGSTSVNFHRISIPDLNVSFPSVEGHPLQLIATESAFYPEAANKRPQLLLNSGTVAIDGWRTLTLDRALLEFPKGALDVVGMRFMSSEGYGTLELAGTVDFSGKSQDAVLAVKASSLPFADLVGKSLGEIIVGVFDSANSANVGRLSMPLNDPESASLEMNLKGSSPNLVQLHQLPFLGFFATTLQDKWFELPIFEDESSLTVRRQHGVVEISDIRLEHKSRMAVRGNLVKAANGDLSGTLDVGLAIPIALAAPTEQFRELFSEEHSGFRWIQLTIGGSHDAPTDNMSRLYLGTETREAERPASYEDEEMSVPSFEDLTQPR